MKLYNLLLEVLDDKVFKQKLDTMPGKDQDELVDLVNGLNEEEKKQFRSLLNKYSSPSQLKSPSGDLELKIEKLAPKGKNIGPGEILFHLQLKDSTMVGDTTHDLVVGGEVYEVKKVGKSGGPLRPGKKGKITKFEFAGKMFEMVSYLDKVTTLLPKIKDDIQDISPELLSALESYNNVITTKFTPKQAILQGELSNKVRQYMVNTINVIKKEIEKNTDNEFTTVKFGGVGVSTKNKGIGPVKVDKIDGDSITLDFVGEDVLKILEVLNEFPYAKEGDFAGDIIDASKEALSDFPSLIIYSTTANRLVTIPKENVVEDVVLDSISQGDIRFKVSPKIWK
jgi:hypothetical protein